MALTAQTNYFLSALGFACIVAGAFWGPSSYTALIAPVASSDLMPINSTSASMVAELTIAGVKQN